MSGRHRHRHCHPSAAALTATLALVAACPNQQDGTAEEQDDAEAASSEDDEAEPEPREDDEAPADAASANASEDAAPPPVVLPPARPVPPSPVGLPPVASPAGNPTSAEKVALGELLFFDPRLSAQGSMSCAHCHAPDQAFADGKRRARTARGVTNARHTPSLLNTGYAGAWFWDGSADTLEGAIASNWRGQMAAEPFSAAADMHAIPVYRAHFERAFGDIATPDRIAQALAAFTRTLRSGGAPWDRYERGDGDAVDEDAVRGFRLFSGKAQCAVCHPPPLYTDRAFHHTGAAAADSPRDPGRQRVTRRPGDAGAMRTPSLRGLAHTAPYFHDGSAATLEDAVRIMAAGGRGGRGRDLEPIHLTADERADLLAFLRALSPEPEPYDRPNLPAPSGG